MTIVKDIAHRLELLQTTFRKQDSFSVITLTAYQRFSGTTLPHLVYFPDYSVIHSSDINTLHRIFVYTVVLHLSGLIATASHPDTQKTPITGSFFDNTIHWQFGWGKNSTNGRFRLHIYVRTNKAVINSSSHVIT
jgi:hypothetical protein